MNTYELIKEFMNQTGLNEDQVCAIFNMSRQNIYNIKKSESKYHRFLRELIVITLNVPASLHHLLKTNPMRFDDVSRKLIIRYLKEKGIKIKKNE